MISFIICTYNRCQYIYETLSRLARSIKNPDTCEILLINNNSTDDTEEECMRFKSDYPVVKYHYYVELQQGLSHARNRGAKEAKGDLLVFLDDDAFVDDAYVSNLLTQISKHPDVQAFGGKITPLYESGVEPEWISKWSYSWVSALNMGNETKLFVGGAYPIGANMGISRKCFDECGVFDTSLGRTKRNMMGGEEKDMFNRVKQAGFSIYYFPDIVVQHVIPESRTTKEYIIKYAKGVGKSERIRTKEQSALVYAKRLFMECVKWLATLLLWIVFFIKGETLKGNVLVLFRRYVTESLLREEKK